MKESAKWYYRYHSFSQSLHLHSFIVCFFLSNRIAFMFSIINFTQLFHSTLHQENQENASLRFGRKEVHVICRGQHVVCQSLIPLMNYSYGEFLSLLFCHQIFWIFKYSETIQSRYISHNYILEYLWRKLIKSLMVIFFLPANATGRLCIFKTAKT